MDAVVRRVDGAVAAGFQIAVAPFGDREDDVRRDAVLLGAFAGNAEEPPLGDLQFAALQADQALHGALAEGLAADHHAQAVVLDGAGENLRGGGRVAVHDHSQRAVPQGAVVGILVDVRPAVEIGDLHDRPGFHEQAGEFHRFLQRAAAVVAQIDDQAVHALGLEFADVAGDVAGGAGVVGVAIAQGLEVDVEGGHGDHADAVREAIAFRFQQRLGGRLFFELHHVADDLHHAGLAQRRFLRLHLEQHRGTLGAAN